MEHVTSLRYVEPQKLLQEDDFRRSVRQLVDALVMLTPFPIRGQGSTRCIAFNVETDPVSMRISLHRLFAGIPRLKRDCPSAHHSQALLHHGAKYNVSLAAVIAAPEHLVDCALALLERPLQVQHTIQMCTNIECC